MHRRPFPRRFRVEDVFWSIISFSSHYILHTKVDYLYILLINFVYTHSDTHKIPPAHKIHTRNRSTSISKNLKVKYWYFTFFFLAFFSLAFSDFIKSTCVLLSKRGCGTYILLGIFFGLRRTFEGKFNFEPFFIHNGIAYRKINNIPSIICCFKFSFFQNIQICKIFTKPY